MGICSGSPRPRKSCGFLLQTSSRTPTNQSHYLCTNSFPTHTGLLRVEAAIKGGVGVRGHSSPLPFPFRQLLRPPLHFRSSSVSVTSSVVFLIEPTAEELSSSFRPAVRLLPSAPFIFIFIFRDGVTPSRHLSSYFPSCHFHFIYLFHCPIVVYISTLSDRKVPILFFLDFLSGKSLPV